MMKYKIVIADTARADLISIVDGISELIGEIDGALEFIDKLKRHCEMLEDFPYGGCVPSDEEIAARGFRFLIYGTYLIFYTVAEDKGEVRIISVFNSKRDYTLVLKEYSERLKE